MGRRTAGSRGATWYSRTLCPGPRQEEARRRGGPRQDWGGLESTRGRATGPPHSPFAPRAAGTDPRRGPEQPPPAHAGSGGRLAPLGGPEDYSSVAGARLGTRRRGAGLGGIWWDNPRSKTVERRRREEKRKRSRASYSRKEIKIEPTACKVGGKNQVTFTHHKHVYFLQ